MWLSQFDLKSELHIPMDCRVRSAVSQTCAVHVVLLAVGELMQALEHSQISSHLSLPRIHVPRNLGCMLCMALVISDK